MFVEWECGCAGLRLLPDNQQLVNIVISACDSDGQLSFGVSQRDLSKKSWQAMSDVCRNKYIKEIASLMSDGYRLRTVRSALI
jgi:hypothetical protein